MSAMRCQLARLASDGRCDLHTLPWHLLQLDHTAALRTRLCATLAPATANIIAKTACGIADDLLSTLMTAVACPVILAPAMNERMWANPVVQANVERLGLAKALTLLES